MKYLILVISLFLLGACFSKKIPKAPLPKKEIKVMSQEEKFLATLDKKQKDLYKDLKYYLSQVRILNTENIVQMTYPKLFLAFSEDTFRAQIFTMRNSSKIAIQSFETNISKIEKVQDFSNGSFSQIDYSSKIILEFISPDLYNTKSSIGTLYSILARKYGIENIYVDMDKRLVTIKKEVKLLAIKEKPNTWKFLVDNPAYRTYYPSILPYDILNQI